MSPSSRQASPRDRSPFEHSGAESAPPLHLIFENLNEGIVTADLDGSLLFWNRAASIMHGFEPGDDLRRHLSTFFQCLELATLDGRVIPFEDWPMSRLLRGESLRNYDLMVRRLDKDWRRIFTYGGDIIQDSGGRQIAVLTISDITDRESAAIELRETQERFRALVEGVRDYAIVMLDPEGNVVTWNSGAESIFGYRPEEVLGRSFGQFFEAADFERGQPQLELAEAARDGRSYSAGWRVRKSGSRFWASAVLTVLYHENGKVRGYAKVTRDLTEQHQIEERLRQQADIIRSSDDAIVGLDLHGVIQSWNRGAEQTYGYSEAQALGRPFSMLGESTAELERRIQEVAQGRHPDPLEVVRVRSDGRSIEVFSRFSPVLDANGNVLGVSAIGRDISDRKKLEAQLRQSQKMEAFGQLAGGVAHDFNNLLTVISGSTEILLSKAGSDDQDELVRQIQDAGERAASLTRQLLAFSRQQVLEPQIVNLNAIVKNTELMLKRLIGEDVDLAAVLAADLHPVKVDPGQIEQVIVNLAVNARDAMPRGGKLTIQTQNVELDEEYARHRFDTRAGRYVLLAISDTGQGMRPEIRDRIFEPFFTTKEVGKGTGLGLAVVQGIVKQSGGSIEVYSEEGVGTTFKIYLPVAQGRNAQAPNVNSSAKPGRGTETILLVEDEQAVRQLSVMALRSFGYTILEAANGPMALELAQQHAGKIDLIVTDVVMPEMSGSRLAERFEDLRPGIKVLFLSGYMEDAVVRHGILQAEVAFLQKPFTPTSLAKKVREVLDAP